MWDLYLSVTATTTCSRKERDLLMNWASFNVMPSLFVFFVLSDPARSTRWSFETIIFSEDSTLDFDSMWIVNMQWDQELALFSLWAEIVLFVSPSKRKLSASSSFAHTFIERPLTLTFPLGSSWMEIFPDYSWVGTDESKSNINSL